MTYAVDIDHISKRFGAHIALDNVSLSIESGQIFGLLGPNGAGKTTLLRILTTLLKPDSGSARLAGIDVVKNDLLARQQMGLVNANMGLYQRLSGRENLRFFAELAGLKGKAIDQRIDSLQAQLGIESWIEQKSGGYSTGMRQKIVIARAILHSPKILVLDEASNGLDVFARRGLIDFARGYADAGNLVIYCTHVMSEVEELCQKVAILHEGKMLANAAIEQLKTQCATDTLEAAFFQLASVKSPEASHA